MNNDFHIYDYGQVLPKNESLSLLNNFRFKYEDTINYVAILMQDMLDNIYELEVNFSIIKKRKDNIIFINSTGFGWVMRTFDIYQHDKRRTVQQADFITTKIRDKNDSLSARRYC